MSTLADVATSLGRDLVGEVKTSIGEDYNSLTTEQTDSIQETAIFYYELQLRAKAGEDVADKLQAVASTVQDWKVWGELGVEDAFWKGVQKVASIFGTFLGAAAKTIIPL